MRKCLGAISLILLVLASPAQVTISDFSPNGPLTWTNLAARGLSISPIYSVERSSSLTGVWETLTNTSETSIQLTNFQPAVLGRAFYRVTWTNGEVWSYESVAATGRLYFALSPRGCIIDGGVWHFNPGSAYRYGSGPLFPRYDAELDCTHLITFEPGGSDNDFWIDVLNRGSDTWSGNWYYSGFITTVQGTFVARKIIPGQ